MSKLKVIVTSTRPGRIGPSIGRWFADVARAHGKFDAELVDLADVALPLLDEAEHPRFGRYQHEHTKRWSAIVRDADAFVFVTPEYDFFPPATLVNAVQCLYDEWLCKPASFVSYGGMSGGMRSVQAVKPLLTSVKVMPLPEAVSIPYAGKLIEGGVFKSDELHAKAGATMLDELHRWAGALAPLRGR